MKIQFFMKNGPRIHEKSFSTQKAIKRSSFCSIFNENRMKIIFWLQILALPRDEVRTSCANILRLHVIGMLLGRFFIEKMNEQ
jgi:hypothetical protein